MLSAFATLLVGCTTKPAVDVEPVEQARQESVEQNFLDNQLRNKLLGAWYNEQALLHKDFPNEVIKVQGKDFYYSNGTVEGYAVFQYPNKAEDWTYGAKWWVKNGYLYMQVVSDSSKTLVDGHQSKDQIFSITDTELILIAEDGTKLVRYRE